MPYISQRDSSVDENAMRKRGDPRFNVGRVERDIQFPGFLEPDFDTPDRAPIAEAPTSRPIGNAAQKACI